VNLEKNVSAALRYGAAAGIVIVAVGLFTDIMIASDIGEKVMIAGIAAIVLTPLAGMAAAMVTLSVNKERSYALSALALIAITAAGMIITFWLV
jgi:uncharacterized membrane protein